MSPFRMQQPTADNLPHHLFTKAVRSLHARRNAPPPIPIPVNPIWTDVDNLPTTRLKTPFPVTIELSNYPPQLTRGDVHKIFEGFPILPDFALPNTTRLAYPLRTLILVVGEAEAERAVKELSGKLVGGRQIYVAIMGKDSYQHRETAVAELADELKIGIINTARVYYSHLASKILEVREHAQGALHFLQTRDLVTIHSEPEAHLRPIKNKADWECVTAGCSDKRNVNEPGERSGRLSALKDLQNTVETQGRLKKTWCQWAGSRILDMES